MVLYEIYIRYAHDIFMRFGVLVSLHLQHIVYHKLGLLSPLNRQSQGVMLNEDFSVKTLKRPTSPTIL